MPGPNAKSVSLLRRDRSGGLMTRFLSFATRSEVMSRRELDRRWEPFSDHGTNL
jgi:hypothetical protein